MSPAAGPALEEAPDTDTVWDNEWRFRLYVAGDSPKSLEAFINLKRICEAHLRSRYEIEVIDLLEYPELARSNEIVALPTLVRQSPAPTRKIIGDLSDVARVLTSLQLVPVQS